MELTKKQAAALLLLRDHGEMTSDTALFLKINATIIRSLCEKGLLRKFHCYTEEHYTQEEQRKIGFHGGLGWPDELQHAVSTYKITIKGHHALRSYT